MAAHSALICNHTSLNAKNADTRALNAQVAKWSFRGQLSESRCGSARGEFPQQFLQAFWLFRLGFEQLEQLFLLRLERL
jgi:hypothetical protein